MSTAGRRRTAAGACPRCHGPTARIPRRTRDMIAGIFRQIRRHRCIDASCGWEGNLRVQRRALLFRDPW